jgi:hypothetical protein
MLVVKRSHDPSGVLVLLMGINRGELGIKLPSNGHGFSKKLVLVRNGEVRRDGSPFP